MIRTIPRFHAILKKLALALAIVALGEAYLWYFGLPPYYWSTSIYPGRPDAALTAKIDRLMSEVRLQYPDPALRIKVERISSEWPRIAKLPRDRLSRIGLGALPYVEQQTRSNDPLVRSIAYEMLWSITITGKPVARRSPGEDRKEMLLGRKYVNPIWELALYDSLPVVRQLAIRRADLGANGIRVYQRMLRDPNQEVKIAAARQLMGSYYNRRDLVPMYLQRLSRESGVE